MTKVGGVSPISNLPLPLPCISWREPSVVDPMGKGKGLETCDLKTRLIKSPLATRYVGHSVCRVITATLKNYEALGGFTAGEIRF